MTLPRSKKAVTKGSRGALTRSRSGSGTKDKPTQVKALEALAAQKVEELERLTRENADLTFRKQMLERVVQLRDHQLLVMRGGTAAELPGPWCGPASTAVAAPPCRRDGGTGAQPPPTASGGAAVGGGQAASGSASSGSSDGRASFAAGSCGGAGATSGANGANGSVAQAIRSMSSGCLLGCPNVALPAVDRERFRTMGKQRVLEGWKHFLSEVSSPLLALEADPDDEGAAVALRQHVAEATFLLKHISLLAPDTLMLVSQTHLESGALSSPDPGHWRTVVATLELTPEQVSELAAVWALFRDIMAGITAERRELVHRLAEGAARYGGGGGGGGGGGSAAEVAAAMAQLTVSPECELLQALQRSLRREKSAHLLVRGYLFGRCLSALQFVRAAVHSYPWLPDATALVATVAEDGGGSHH